MARKVGIDRERVLDVAEQIADQHGPEGVTLSVLARRLKVAPPSLYTHVGGLDDLRSGLRLRGLRTMTDLFRRRTVGLAADDALAAVAGELRRFVQDHPGLYAASVAAPGRQDPEEVQRAAEDLLGVFTAILRGFQITPAELVHSARFARSALHGFVSLESTGGFGLPEDVDVSYSRLVGAVNHDLSHWRGRRR
jgi:AcrR family transcriptional regulator